MVFKAKLSELGLHCSSLEVKGKRGLTQVPLPKKLCCFLFDLMRLFYLAPF